VFIKNGPLDCFKYRKAFQKQT